MAKRKKAPTRSKFHRYAESVTVQMPDQAGLGLEQFCDEREVGMDCLIHWNDATLEEMNIYNLMEWIELDDFHLGKGYTLSGFHGVTMRSPVTIDHFQHLFNIMKSDDGYLSLSNIYQNTESFRYAEPEELTREANKFNFAFNDITNIGFAARSIHF